MRLDEILPHISICLREDCGHKGFCHRPIARSGEEFSKVPHEIAAVLPERWLCLPHLSHRNGLPGHGLRPVSASDVEKWLTGGFFNALLLLEENDFACLSVDVHYPDSRRVMVLYNYYNLSGILVALVAEYRGPVGTLRTVLVTDDAQKVVRFLSSWRRELGRELKRHASLS